MIRLEHVSKSYESKRVFQDLNAAFSLNQSYLLIGASGAGKTTLLRLLAGLEEPETGRIIRPEGLRIRLVFQEDRLLPELSVRDNVILEKGRAEKAQALLEELGLGLEAGALPESLSGGMKRRVALARALCAAPDVLLLDEPFNGLDEAWRRRAAALIFREMTGKCVICATHYPEEVAPYAPQRIGLE